MAYSKAWRILRDCEKALGFELLVSTTGGRHGGGAVLTEHGAALLADYERFCEKLREQGDALFEECLGHWSPGIEILSAPCWGPFSHPARKARE